MSAYVLALAAFLRASRALHGVPATPDRLEARAAALEAFRGAARAHLHALGIAR